MGLIEKAAEVVDARQVAVMGEQPDSEVVAKATADPEGAVRRLLVGTSLEAVELMEFCDMAVHQGYVMGRRLPLGLNAGLWHALLVHAVLTGYHARDIEEKEKDHGESEG